MAEPARILLVEDHPVFRAGLRQTLEDEPGLSVCGEAGSAEEALEILALLDPDLVVVDLMLPGTGGLSLVKRIRRLRSSLPILVLSMHDERLFAERALRSGANGYVGKQVPIGEIVEAVRRVLSGGTWLSERMRRRLEVREAEGNEGLGDPSEVLSDREVEVFGLLGLGLGTREIAERLDLSVKTVESYREKIKAKLLLDSGAELTLRAVAWSLTRG